MNNTPRQIYDRQIPFNDLPELPPEESILDREVLVKWGLASRALAELSRNLLRMPNPNMLVNTISLQEARSSTEIENIFTTDDKLYMAVSDTLKEEAADAPTREVIRYREALWSGYKTLSRKNLFTMETIVKVFQRVKNTRQGVRPAQSQVVVRRGNTGPRPGAVIYTPPRGGARVERKLGNLVSFLNDDQRFDPLLKMAIAHYQFEAIHPFTDGNGRTGRILNLLYLMNQGLLSHPVLHMSKFIIENKSDYYHLLASVTERGAWKPWLLFMLNAVESTALHTNQKIDEILNQMDATYRHAHKKLKWYSFELNMALFSQPYIKQKMVGEVTGARSRTTLTKYMAQLSKLGIVSAQEDGREVYFVNNDLIRILEN